MPKRSWMKPEELNFIQVAIIEMCDQDDGKTSIEIWEHENLTPMTKKYARGTIMDIVHTLKRVGYLFDFNKTKGNIYFTTALGREIAKKLRCEAKGDMPNSPV